jgi:hypothetical protein
MQTLITDTHLPASAKSTPHKKKWQEEQVKPHIIESRAN